MTASEGQVLAGHDYHITNGGISIVITKDTIDKCVTIEAGHMGNPFTSLTFFAPDDELRAFGEAFLAAANSNPEAQ